MPVRPLSEVAVGDVIGPVTVPVARETLVAYANASLDQNPIHQDEEFARSVGLPDVIAHGMLTMATAGRVVTEWVGDPGAIESYSVRFSKPVVVPDDDTGATVQITAVVAEKLDSGRVAVDLTATSDDHEVLTQARAVVLLRL